MALDFGLSTRFAGDDGSLPGNDWLKALRAYDKRTHPELRTCRDPGQAG